MSEENPSPAIPQNGSRKPSTKQINAEVCPTVQIWEQGEGKANSFLSLYKAPAKREQAQGWENAHGPPRNAGALLEDRDQMETEGMHRGKGRNEHGGDGRAQAMLLP